MRILSTALLPLGPDRTAVFSDAGFADGVGDAVAEEGDGAAAAGVADEDGESASVVMADVDVEEVFAVSASRFASSSLASSESNDTSFVTAFSGEAINTVALPTHKTLHTSHSKHTLLRLRPVSLNQQRTGPIRRHTLHNSAHA